MEVSKIFAPPRGRTEKIRQVLRSDEGSEEECAHCGATHEASKCPFRYATCHYCKKRGHIAEKCFKLNIKKKPEDTIKKKSVRQIEVESADLDNFEEVYIINRISAPLEKVDPYYVDINICDKRISMEIDTGASVTIMGLKTWKKINNKKSLGPTKLHLKSYMGNSIHVIGQTKVPVQLDCLRWE